MTYVALSNTCATDSAEALAGADEETRRLVLRKVREYTASELTGRDSEHDARPAAPTPAQCGFHRTGLANWWLPSPGGRDELPLELGVDIVSELAYGDAGTAFTLFISILGSSVISLFGPEHLRRRYLVPMARDGGFCATLASEQDAGSELTRNTATLSIDGESAVVTGEKYFATNADFAGFLVVYCGSGGPGGQPAAVVVPRATPGVRVVRRWPTIGLRSAGTYQVSLDGCRVPADHVLPGNGLRILEAGLNASRILMAACAVGIARRLRDLCLDYASVKTLRGDLLLHDPLFAAKLGQMETRITVMRSQCLAAARDYDQVMAQPDAAAGFLRRGTLKQAIVAKMFCGQAGWEVAGAASLMFGGLGYTDEHPAGKLTRDMRHVSIVEGGDDVLSQLLYQRYVLAGTGAE